MRRTAASSPSWRRAGTSSRSGPSCERALDVAGMGLADLDGIAVTQGPGLVGSLLIGCSVAKSIAYARGLPLVGVNHLEGHVYAAFLERTRPSFPFLALVVSGGHTALYVARERGRVRADRPDARRRRRRGVRQGRQAPGPRLSRAARSIERVGAAGNARAIVFPTAQMSDGAPDFSFSGIKTAVSLHVRRRGPARRGPGRRRRRLVPGDGGEDARAQDRAGGAATSASIASC